MENNYKRIGDYIRRLSIKNTDGKIDLLLGININKYFMPSVANVVGTNLSKYKIVKKNQFACNRMHVGRDYRLPVAISKSNYDFIISPAYDVFEIINDNILSPDYLMMWMTRKEFDRNSWFYTDSDVRGKLGWDDFCDMKLPVPSIEKQKEIVKEYDIITNRIKLNENFNEKLEETAQAIFKEWFVDFNFPMTKEYAEKIGKPKLEGKSYKDNGGELEYSDKLSIAIPKGWHTSSLSGVAKYLNGLAMQKYESKTEEYLPVLKIRELNKGYTDINSGKASLNIPIDYIVKDEDVIFSWSASLKVDIWCGGTCGLNQHLFKVTSNQYEKWFYYLATKYHLSKFIRIADGNKTSMGHIKREHLDNAITYIPIDNHFKNMNQLMKPLLTNIVLTKKVKFNLMKLKYILLSKMAKGE